MIFNGTDLSSRIIIKRIRRGMSGDISTVTLNPPSKIGSHFVRRKIESRVIEVEYTVMKTTRALFLDEIRALVAILITDGPKVLKFKDDTIQYNAILTGGTDVDEIHARGGGKLTFLCPDPHKYATADTMVVDPVSITLDGHPTPCLMEFTLNETASYIQVNIGTGYIKLTQSFASGDVVVIDTDKRTAVLNGVVDIRSKKDILSSWVLAQTGAVSVFPLTSDLELTYRKRWL